MITVQNPRSTIGKYRNLTGADWNAILEQITRGVGLAKITASTNNRPVAFTRAEVSFILEKYGRAA